ncbi:MAG: hypothetical protein WC477_02835 [Patescibacteria group bacterium]
MGVIFGIVGAIFGILSILWDIVMILAESPTSCAMCIVYDCDKKGFDGTEGLALYILLIVCSVWMAAVSIHRPKIPRAKIKL